MFLLPLIQQYLLPFLSKSFEAFLLPLRISVEENTLGYVSNQLLDTFYVFFLSVPLSRRLGSYSQVLASFISSTINRKKYGLTKMSTKLLFLKEMSLYIYIGLYFSIVPISGSCGLVWLLYLARSLLTFRSNFLLPPSGCLPWWRRQYVSLKRR